MIGPSSSAIVAQASPPSDDPEAPADPSKPMEPALPPDELAGVQRPLAEQVSPAAQLHRIHTRRSRRGSRPKRARNEVPRGNPHRRRTRRSALARTVRAQASRPLFLITAGEPSPHSSSKTRDRVAGAARMLSVIGPRSICHRESRPGLHQPTLPVEMPFNAWLITRCGSRDCLLHPSSRALSSARACQQCPGTAHGDARSPRRRRAARFWPRSRTLRPR